MSEAPHSSRTISAGMISPHFMALVKRLGSLKLTLFLCALSGALVLSVHYIEDTVAFWGFCITTAFYLIMEAYWIRLCQHVFKGIFEISSQLQAQPPGDHAASGSIQQQTQPPDGETEDEGKELLTSMPRYSGPEASVSAPPPQSPSSSRFFFPVAFILILLMGFFLNLVGITLTFLGMFYFPELENSSDSDTEADLAWAHTFLWVGFATSSFAFVLLLFRKIQSRLCPSSRGKRVNSADEESASASATHSSASEQTHSGDFQEED